MAVPISCGYIGNGNYVQIQSASSISSQLDVTALSAPGANKYLALMTAVVSVPTVGSGGIIKLENGVDGDVLFKTSTVGTYSLNFGGLCLGVNSALNLTCETADSSANCCAVGVVKGI